MVDGRTACLPCAAKVREAPTRSQGLDFGTKVNTVLDAVAKGILGLPENGNPTQRAFVTACAANAYEAASLRHDGNRKFGAKEYSAAVEVYNKGREELAN